MRQVFLALAVLLACVSACNTRTEIKASKSGSSPTCPFSLSIVPGTSQAEPGGSSVEMAHENPREFYVLLTNDSAEPRAVWGNRNSWGYQSISFELRTADGKAFTVSVRQHPFTANFPSTFLIEPGEHQVYAIRLDKEWEARPLLPEATETTLKLRAIYEVRPSLEASQYRAWTGRLESRDYTVRLLQR